MSEEKKGYTYLQVAEKLIHRYKIVTDINSKLIFLYNNQGFYDKAYSTEILQQQASILFGNSASRNKIEEAIAHIIRTTYQELTIQDKYICLNNGILNTETLEFEPHTPDIITLFHLPVTYDNSIDIEPIESYTKKIVLPDTAITLQEMCGNILVPHYATKKLLYAFGINDSGKSTFFDIFQKILGKKNYSNLSLNQLGEKFTNASIYLKRANFFSDVPYNIPIRYEAMIKNFTGGDTVTLQFKHVNSFEYENQAKLFFSGNGIPRVDEDVHDAFYRRWQFIHFPFKFSIPDETIIDRYTTEKMKSAWLRWMLIGLERLRDNHWKLTHNQSVSEVKNIFENSMTPINHFEQWLASSCTAEIGKSEFVEKLFAHCRKWFREEGYTDGPKDIKSFGNAMAKQKIFKISVWNPTDQTDGKQKRAYSGVVLSE